MTGRIWLVLPALWIAYAPRADAAIPVVDGCAEADYLDRSAPGADRRLTWDYSFSGSGEACLKIFAGQSVTWVGSFPDHPLSSDQGSTPNPISQHGPEGLVTFTAPGIYGFRCDYHFEMRGAIQVLAAPAAVPAFGLRGSGLLLLGLFTILGVSSRARLRGADAPATR